MRAKHIRIGKVYLMHDSTYGDGEFLARVIEIETKNGTKTYYVRVIPGGETRCYWTGHNFKEPKPDSEVEAFTHQKQNKLERDREGREREENTHTYSRKSDYTYQPRLARSLSDLGEFEIEELD